MSTIKLKDSLFNSSVKTKCSIMAPDDNDAGLSILSISLLTNFVVALPANVWVVWLITCGTKELLASDIYLLSLAVCEIFYCLGLPAQLYCMYSFDPDSDAVSYLLSVLSIPMWIGRPMFQTCICVDRYIAVVHPLLFIRFKSLKYKVAQCALAWCVFCLTLLFVWTFSPESDFVFIWFISIDCILLYCYFSILCSLKRPGPGESDGEERRSGNKMKRTAFNIILIHLVCLAVNFLPTMIVTLLKKQIKVSGTALNIVTSLAIICGPVQPLLYLRRAGKLTSVREHSPEG